MNTKWIVHVVLLAAIAGLVRFNAHMAAREAEARQASNRVGRLVESAERDALRVAAVSVLSGDGRRFLYGRVNGLWRCIDHHEAVADEAAISALVESILAAEGVAQTDDPARFADYGIGTPDGWRVQLHGSEVMARPDRHVIFELDVGLAVEGLDGCFVRRGDRQVVWAVDTDPRALLTASRPGDPPLLDYAVLPGAWAASGAQIQRIQIDRADGVRYQLDLRERELTPDQMQRGVPPWGWWMVRPDMPPEECHPQLATSYGVYLRRAEIADVVPRDRVATMGLELPAARVAIVSGDTTVTQLILGAVLGDGRVPMYSSFSDSVVLLDESTSRLLTPAPAELLMGAAANPWDLALRR